MVLGGNADIAEDAPLGSFAGLVAGIGTDERHDLLQKLKRSGSEMPRPLTRARDEIDGNSTLQTRLKHEGIFYRIWLWIRAVFTQRNKEELYNSDIVNNLARTINVQHPGIIDSQRRLLLTSFLEKLKGLKDSADFFKPYIDCLVDRRGEFYVFMGTLIAPEISDEIDSTSNPYSLPLDREVFAETKSSLLHKLNDTLMNVTDTAKQHIRSSVICLEWLRSFACLHYEHFISQFTQSSSGASAMFSYAKSDYAELCRVLSSAMTVTDKVLDALYLFSKNNGKMGHGGAQAEGVADAGGDAEAADDSAERELQEFVLKANTKLSMVQMFLTTVPVVSLGKVIWGSYDWNPSAFGGGEDWQKLFRTRWREIFDERWNAWMIDRKKVALSNTLSELWDAAQFPVLKARPWAAVRGVEFRPEMTAAFLVWFCENEWPLITSSLKQLMMEGVFVVPANQNEFSVAVNEVFDVMRRAEEFSLSLKEDGALCRSIQQLSSERMNTINWQSKITSVILTAETEVREMSASLCSQCRTIEKIFHGIFDDDISTEYDTVRNLNKINGADNKEFRDSILRARKSLDGARSVLAELESLETPVKTSKGDENAV